LVKGELSGLAGLLGDCVELSPDVGGPDGLGYSEIEQIKTGFMEVNRAFFDLAAATGGMLLQCVRSPAFRRKTDRKEPAEAGTTNNAFRYLILNLMAVTLRRGNASCGGRRGGGSAKDNRGS